MYPLPAPLSRIQRKRQDASKGSDFCGGGVCAGGYDSRDLESNWQPDGRQTTAFRSCRRAV